MKKSILFALMLLSTALVNAQCWVAEPAASDLVCYNDTVITKQFNAVDGQSLYFYSNAEVNLHLNKNNKVYVYKSLNLTNVNVDHNNSTVYLAEGATLLINGAVIKSDSYHTKKGNSVLNIERCNASTLPVKFEMLRIKNNVLEWKLAEQVDQINVQESTDAKTWKTVCYFNGNATRFPLTQVGIALGFLALGFSRKRWLGFLGIILFFAACTKEMDGNKSPSKKYYRLEIIKGQDRTFSKILHN